MKTSVPLRWLALAFAVTAVGLAIVRCRQVVVTYEPAELPLTQLHNLDWNADTGVFTVTGPDPFVHIDLPAGSIPLFELRFEFAGAAQPGGWYVYPSPAIRPLPELNQDWVVTARVEHRGDNHSLVWPLEASRLARLDFPDELAVPMTLQRAVLTTRFASSTNPIFLTMVLLAAGALALVTGPTIRRLSSQRLVESVAMVLLLVVKLWVVSGFGQTIMAPLVHDDRLFLNQAESILAGAWLGPYHAVTLAKGPVYPLFIAFAAWSGLSLQVAEVLLHALAAAVLVAAVAPWVRRGDLRLLLFAVLLFEPHALSAEVLARVLRVAIQPALTLLTLAGAIGLVARADRKPRVLWPWALLTGLAGSAFWYSREEGIWLAPSVLLLLGTAAVIAWRAQTGRRVAWLACLVLPLLILQGAKQTLRTINQHHYGVPFGIDVHDGTFPDAYGAMLRVTPVNPIPGVPASVEARHAMYDVSPTFAELRDEIEGPMTRVWARAGWRDPSDPHAGREIRGGWYQWAIRQAAETVGWYASATEAEAKWQKVADELNTAVDEGRLPGGAQRRGFFPVWHPAYTAALPTALSRAADMIVRCNDFKPHFLASNGPPEEIAHFTALLNAEPVTEYTVPPPSTHARAILHWTWTILGWPLTALALIATINVAMRTRRRPEFRPRFAVLLALWGGALSLALVVALVDVTSFPAIHGVYAAPAAPLVFACWVLAPVWAWSGRESPPAT